MIRPLRALPHGLDIGAGRTGQQAKGDSDHGDHMRQVLAQVTPEALYVDGPALATALGNTKVTNVVLLGALAARLQALQWSGPDLTTNQWLEVIIERVPPKYAELNRQAFLAGQRAAEKAA